MRNFNLRQGIILNHFNMNHKQIYLLIYIHRGYQNVINLWNITFLITNKISTVKSNFGAFFFIKSLFSLPKNKLTVVQLIVLMDCSKQLAWYSHCLIDYDKIMMYHSYSLSVFKGVAIELLYFKKTSHHPSIKYINLLKTR